MGSLFLKSLLLTTLLTLAGIPAFAPIKVQADELQKTEREIRDKLENRYSSPDTCKNIAKNSPQALACESVRLKIQNLDQGMAPAVWRMELAWKNAIPHPFPKKGCQDTKSDALACTQKILQQDFQNILSDLLFGIDCSKYTYTQLKPFVKVITTACSAEKSFQDYYNCLAQSGESVLQKFTKFRSLFSFKDKVTKADVCEKAKSSKLSEDELQFFTVFAKQSICKNTDLGSVFQQCSSTLPLSTNQKECVNSQLAKLAPGEYIHTKLLALKRVTQEMEITRQYCKKRNARSIGTDCGSDYLTFASDLRSADLFEKNKARFLQTEEGLDRASISPFSENKWFCPTTKKTKKEEPCTNCDRPEVTPPIVEQTQSGDIAQIIQNAGGTTVKIEADENFSTPEKPNSTELSFSGQVTQAIDQVFQKHKNDKNLNADQKKILQDLQENKKYRANLEQHYVNTAKTLKGDDPKKLGAIKKNFDLALTQAVGGGAKNTDEQKEQDADFTFEEEEALELASNDKKPNTVKNNSPSPKNKQTEETAQDERQNDGKEKLEKERALLETLQKTFAQKSNSEPTPVEVPLNPLKFDKVTTRLSSEQKELNKTLRSQVDAAAKDPKHTDPKAMAELGKTILLSEVEDLSLSPIQKATMRGKIAAEWEVTVVRYKNFFNEVKDRKDLSFEEKLSMLETKINYEFTHKYVERKEVPSAIFMIQCFQKEHCNCVGNTKLSTALTLAVLADEKLPENKKILVQTLGDHVAAVLYDTDKKTIWDFLRGGTPKTDLKGSFYNPAVLANAELKRKWADSIDNSLLLVFDGRLEATEEEKKQMASSGFWKTNPLKLALQFSDGLPSSPMLEDFTGSENKKTEDQYGLPYMAPDKKMGSATVANSNEAGNPVVDFTKAKKDLQKLTESKEFQEMLKLRQNPTLLANSSYTEKQIKTFRTTQENALKIVEGTDYVSGNNQNTGKASLAKVLIESNPKLSILFKAIQEEREPLQKSRRDKDKEEEATQLKQFLNLYRVLGAEKWKFYETLTSTDKNESALRLGMQDTSALNGDSPANALYVYFADSRNISIDTKYKVGMSTKSGRIEVSQNANAQASAVTSLSTGSEGSPLTQKKASVQDSKAIVSGTKLGRDSNGIAVSPPENEASEKLDPLKFAELVRLRNQSLQQSPGEDEMSDAGLSRWDATLSAALRKEKKYSKALVEWFTAKGFREISNARGSAATIISGPDGKRISKDIAVLLIDFLRKKDRTGADISTLEDRLIKNYGSVNAYIEKVRQEFGLPPSTATATPVPTTSSIGTDSQNTAGIAEVMNTGIRAFNSFGLPIKLQEFPVPTPKNTQPAPPPSK